MKLRNRALLLLGALCSLMGGVWLLGAIGLPQRADYTGIIDNGVIYAPEIGAAAPPFTAPTLDQPVDLALFRGRPLILNFWATWCEPCRIETPELIAFMRQHGDDVALIGINSGESAAQVAGWAAEYAISFPLALDRDGQITTRYALRGQPTTFILNGNGIITHIFYGAVTASQLAAALPAAR